MKRLILFSTMLLITNFTFGQKLTPTNNDIPNWSNCECFEIVDACSGKPLDLSGTVTLSCILESDDKPWDRTITFSDGKLCLGGLLDECRDSEICINSGNWEVCDINECTVSVFQTAPFNGNINGEPIGYYNGGGVGNSGGYTECVGAVHTGPINSIWGLDNLLLCPGDDVLFSLPGLSIPEESGLCLTVTLKNTNGTVVASQSFNSGSVDGNQVNLTNLFSNAQNQIYILEYRLACCNGDASCTVNTVKYAYIEVEGAFSYSSYARTGLPGGPQFGISNPSTSPPSSYIRPEGAGEIIPGTGIIGNQVTFVGYNVSNTNGTSVDWTWNSVACDGTGTNTQLSNGTDDADGVMFLGPFLMLESSSCQCFRLDLSYDDGCGDGEVTDSYFFKEGENCDDDALQAPNPDNTHMNDHIKYEDVQLNENRLSINTIRNSKEKSSTLYIYNISGQPISNQIINIVDGNIETVVNLSQGIYVYSYVLDGVTYSGKLLNF